MPPKATPPPRGQTSIASFFGGAKPKDGGGDKAVAKREPSADAPPKPKRLRKKGDRASPPPSASPAKENVGDKMAVDAPAASADPSPAPSPAPSPSPASSPDTKPTPAKLAPPPAAKRPGKKAATTAATVANVGAGALAAAADHAAADAAAAATWPPGAPVPFAFLADVFESVADETKRLTITGQLTTAFRAIVATTPEDLLPAVYLCVNRVAPAHAGVELGVGDATLVRAVGEATGKSEAAVKAALKRDGDLGVVAAAARGTQATMFKPPPLTVRSVHKAFRDIAGAAGAGSGERKRAAITRLLAAAGEREAGYIVRGLQGKLRIGLAEQTVLVALAHATELAHGGAALGGGELANRLERAAAAVKRAFCECPSYDALVPALLAGGPATVNDVVKFTPGVPVKPMLAKPATAASEILDRAAGGGFAAEYKYDGERAQVHVLEGGKTVRIYSRNSEDTTAKYPDVAAAVVEALAPTTVDAVFDAEVVAVDPADRARLLPFQVLSTRKRGDVSAADAARVPVCLFAFDCLYLNGDPLLARPLPDRRAALRSALVECPGAVQFAVGAEPQDVDALAAFLDAAVAAGMEGLIVKTAASTYEPSKRSVNWLKLKKDYLDGVGDTFDVVVIGAWAGRGKRTGVYGAFLLAIHDAARDEYASICKVGTGFSEAQLADAAETLAAHVIPQKRPYYNVPDTITPDVWFEPALVWEVKAADLSISPVHKAALGAIEPGKGISIRFPRLVRVRSDKRPEDATSAEQLADMYRRQALAQPDKVAEEDDYY